MESTICGWYFNIGHMEYFVKSDRKNKTKKFAEKILEEMNEDITEQKIKYILYYLIPANLEIKYCPPWQDRILNTDGFYYYNIFGKNFSGCGSRVDDGKTIILEID